MANILPHTDGGLLTAENCAVVFIDQGQRRIPIQFARHPELIGPSDSGPGSVVRPFDRTPGSLEGEPWTDYWKSFIGGGRPPRSFIDPSEEGP